MLPGLNVENLRVVLMHQKNGRDLLVYVAYNTLLIKLPT